MKSLYIFLTLLAVMLISGGQVSATTIPWGADPIPNIKVCDDDGEQVLPKIATTSKGGFYVSWFDKRTGNYKVFINLYKPDGTPDWKSGGIEVSSHQQDTWLTDYDLITDANDNAILAFADTRLNNIQNVFAYKISPQGDFLWGKDGLRLSETDNFQHSPRIVINTDGNIVFGWGVIDKDDFNSISFKMLSPEGTELWDKAIVYSDPGSENTIFSGMVPSNDGSIIFAYPVYSGDPYNTCLNISICAQKISWKGHILWPENNPLKLAIPILNAGGFPYYEKPNIASDGKGGALITWFDDRDVINQFSAYVQHIDYEGKLQFPENGLKVFEQDAYSFTGPISPCRNTDEDIYIFAKGKSGAGYGIWGQKISPSGERLWSDEGISMISGTNAVNLLEPLVCSDDYGINVFYIIDPSCCNKQAKVEGFKVNSEGNFVWNNKIVALSGDYSGKLHLDLSAAKSGKCFLAWEDTRIDIAGIYAQGINPDGTLDDKTDVNGDSEMLMSIENYPNPFSRGTIINYTVPEKGQVSIKIFDTQGKEISCLVDEQKDPGVYMTEYTPENVSSGSYICRMTVNGKSEDKSIVLEK